MIRQAVHLAAAALLLVMAALMLTSVWDDAPTSDDNVALISGYSYLRQRQYWLEPQNPPLIKDLAAVPLLFMRLHEPWRAGWGAGDDPDTLGREFLFHSGNHADRILRAARMPMILLTLALGAFLFWWTRKEYGDFAALLSLFLFAFSPTFIAHGRLVATDIGATAGFLVTIALLLDLLRDPIWPRLVAAGVALGLALLAKFSTIALIPLVLFLAGLWAFLSAPKNLGRTLVFYGWRVLCLCAIAFLLVYLLYWHHISGWLRSDQIQSAILHRDLYGVGGWSMRAVLWASGTALRPLAQYALGLLVALSASSWGQPLFFFGKIYSAGFPAYFPLAYLIKEPLPLHILTLAALIGVLMRLRRLTVTRELIREHFTAIAFFAVLAVYWAALMRSRMNIGVRHLLPAFPFIYVLVSAEMAAISRRLRSPKAKLVMAAALGCLLLWHAVSVLRVHPSYLAYFNEAVGGPENGWKYLNDSNLDWGQDLKRLGNYLEAHGIVSLHGDFFTSADPAYYLQGRYAGPVGCGAPPKGWVAVSATLYPGAPWNPGCDYRRSLPPESAAAKIGHSIFLFNVP